jgi:hypothetical protein
MWRRLLIITGLAALIALFLRRRRPPREELLVEADPASVLRSKLDEAREREEAPPVAGEDDLDARRRGVHERGRAAADEMRRSASD